MLGDYDIFPTIAVTDLQIAKKFYSETLGLELIKEDAHEIIFRTGACRVQVYETKLAGTNKATYASWKVDDITSVVDSLADKGISFMQYDDMEGVTREGNIHSMGDLQAAWFTDPDGNVLCISTQ